MSAYWIGGYTRPGDGGVRRLDPATGGAPVVVRTADPSFLLASPDHPGLLYAVDEGGRAVVAFRGEEVLARATTAGDSPCHLALVDDGRVLLAACYGDGVVTAHRVDEHGIPAAGIPLPAADPAPTGPHPAQDGPHPAQDGPHAHCCLEVDGLLLVADLGTDRVLRYRKDADGFAFDGAVPLPAGSGPRDLLPLPSGAVLVLGEHDARVHVLDPVARRVRASVPATADPAPGDQAAGMTLVGDRLTVGLRGSDRIAVLRIGAGGVPVPVSSAATGGTWPRHHAVDGDRLLVANERSGTITALPLHPDGGLGTAAVVAAVPAPTHLLAADEGAAR